MECVSGSPSAYYSLAYNYYLPGWTPTGCPVTPSGSGNNGNAIGYTYTDVNNYGQAASYVYDKVNRVLCAQATSSNSAAKYNLQFSYDQFGNVSCVTTQYTQGPSCPAWSYSASTNRNSSFSYDAAGDVANDGAHTYTWDGEQHLSSIDGGSISSNALGWRVYQGALSYLTDPSGQLLAATGVRKTLPCPSPGASWRSTPLRPPIPCISITPTHWGQSSNGPT